MGDTKESRDKQALDEERRQREFELEEELEERRESDEEHEAEAADRELAEDE